MINIILVHCANINSTTDFLKLNLNSESLQVLTEDLDFAGIQFNPISFVGKIEGNGHSIRNVNVTHYFNCEEEACMATSGIFGQSVFLQIQNVNFDNITVNVEGQDVILYSGLILGSGNAQLTNVSMKNMKLQQTCTNCQVTTGGLVGSVDQMFELRNTQAKIYFTLNNSEETVTGGIVGTAESNNQKFIIMHNKVHILLTSYGKVLFGGAASKLTMGTIEQTSIEIDLQLNATNNTVGGFFTSDPDTFRVTNSLNSISGEGGVNLTVGGVSSTNWQQKENWNITSLVSIFQLFTPPVYINVANGTFIIPCTNCYARPLHLTPIVISYALVNRTENSNKFNLDPTYWTINKTDIPALQVADIGPYTVREVQQFDSLWILVIAQFVVIAAIVIGALIHNIKSKKQVHHNEPLVISDSNKVQHTQEATQIV